MEQAREIAATPTAEKELLETARNCDLTELREHAREHRQAHTDPEELHRRHLELREFRHWQDREGMVRFTGALPPETGLPFVRRLDKIALDLRRAAKQGSGKQAERFEAYAADALARLMATGPAGATPRASELVIVCDLFAWRRGKAEGGEVCHIIGGGPIPVDVAKELSKDAFVKAVLHDGVAIHTVKHFGRHIRAALRTALDLGPVPAFTGRRCVSCRKPFGLERDHDDPVNNGGATEYANLNDLCYACHQAKTERDRRAGLLGPNAPGRARLKPQPG